MMCKHKVLAVCKVMLPDSMEIKRAFCVHCGKTKTEIDLERQLAAANAKITEQAATIEAMKLCWNCKFIEADRCNKHNCLIDYPMREKCDKWQVKEA